MITFQGEWRFSKQLYREVVKRTTSERCSRRTWR